MSIGRLNMSDEVSLTSGTEPVAGNVVHSVPSIVLFDVMWTYAAPGVCVISDSDGIRVYLSAFVEAATLTLPTFFASLIALSAHDPESM